MEESEKESPKKPPKVVRNPDEWRPFGTSTAKCNCGKYNLKDLPQLERLLPEEYDYKLCDYEELGSSEKFIVTLRMNLATKEEALTWKRSFEEKSLTTHSVVQVYSKVSLKRVFKGMYKCKFNQPWREKRPRKRNPQFEVTDCPSALNIVIKNFAKSGRIRASDPHLPGYATLIRIRFAHNHDIAAPRSLQKRPLCPDIEKRFEEMFRQGIKPKDALDKHKRDLQGQLGMDHYLSVAVDGFYVPDKNKVYRMYTKVMGKTSAKTTTKRVSKHNPDADMIAFDYCATSGKSVVVMDPEEEDGEDVGGVEDEAEEESVSQDHPPAGIGGSNSLEVVTPSSQAVVAPVCGTVAAAAPVMMSADRRHDVGEMQVFDALLPDASHSMAPQGPTVVTEDPNISQTLGMVYENGPVQNTTVLPGGQILQNMTAPVLTLQNMGTHSFEYHTQAAPQVRTSHQMVPTSNFGQLTHLQAPNMTGGNIPIHSGTSSCAVQQGAAIQSLNHQNFSSHHYNIVANISYQPTAAQSILHQNMMNQTPIIQNAFQQHPPHPPPPAPPSQPTLPQNLTVQNISQQYQTQAFRPMLEAPEVKPPQTQAWLSHKGASIRCQPPPLIRKGLGSKLNAQKKRYHNLSNLKTVCRKKGKSGKSEFRANSFRKTLLKKTPRVDPVTHSTAFQAVQNMLLLDESKRLNERFSRFCIDLEEKMNSNLKLFVPGVRNLINTWQDLKDDEERAAALKDFGKLEDKVIEEQRRKKLDNMRDKGVQVVILPPAPKPTSSFKNSSLSKAGEAPVLLMPVNEVPPGQKIFVLPASSRVGSSGTNGNGSGVTEDLILVPADVGMSAREKASLLKSLKPQLSKLRLRTKKSVSSAVRKLTVKQKLNSEILKRLRAPPKSVSAVKKQLEEVDRSRSSSLRSSSTRSRKSLRGKNSNEASMSETNGVETSLNSSLSQMTQVTDSDEEDCSPSSSADPSWSSKMEQSMTSPAGGAHGKGKKGHKVTSKNARDKSGIKISVETLIGPKSVRHSVEGSAVESLPSGT
ncbi:uncharacterized protein LOC101846425 [Aplysia californica]|uniref:Uncharacterized protein LOC101846425 n=1 Tax=Aplysia californica TaxID=6500 RepID=A0ABM0JPE5_APLCA|nr:uncharacterized protein LOC101846425 [Aplysia californica]